MKHEKHLKYVDVFIRGLMRSGVANNSKLYCNQCKHIDWRYATSSVCKATERARRKLCDVMLEICYTEKQTQIKERIQYV